MQALVNQWAKQPRTLEECLLPLPEWKTREQREESEVAALAAALAARARKG